VNRLSFGAQSFNEDTLKFLGRIHSADDTRNAAKLSHQAGFERLNLDLIFAVPGQTLKQVGYDIGEAAALEPDHISAYNLTFEEGTAFFTEMKRGRIRPLENDDQAEMYCFVRNELPQRGYPMYEISNYAEPGHEARHNLSYWRAESYLGLGAGAHGCAISRQMRRRWWNERLPATYMWRAAASGIAEAGNETIDERTAASEFVFLGLRLREGISLVQFEHRFGRSFDSIFSDPASRMMAGGLVERDGKRLRLTDRGLELADSVFAEFL
jgi:oxygen-independent coproporphyrinogen-3 oxidase